MTKGRPALEAIRAALKFAEKRGEVQCHQRGPGRLCDFEIVLPPLLAKVQVMRLAHARLTAKDLERAAAEKIAALRMYPSCREISRELWICSRKYFIRFFRVTDEGLVELGPEGQPLPAGSPPTGPACCRGARLPVKGAVPAASTAPAPVRPATDNFVPVPPVPPVAGQPATRSSDSHGPAGHDASGSRLPVPAVPAPDLPVPQKTGALLPKGDTPFTPHPGSPEPTHT